MWFFAQLLFSFTLTLIETKSLPFRYTTAALKTALAVADSGFRREQQVRQRIITGRNEVVAKVMFLHVSVILLTGGVSREPPQTRQTPPPWTKEKHPPRTKENPPGPDRPPPGPGRPTHPWTKENTPPREEHCSIRSMSGRYASYWNAFLFGKRYWT